MKKHSIFLILIVFTLFIAGCKYDFILPEEVPVIDNSKPISFATQITPIFAEKCISCHNNQTPKLTADVAYSQVVPAYVNTASPASSKIYTVPNSGTHYAKYSTTEAALVLAWLKEGALKN
ncbi:MAG: hypothetical protein Q8S54_18635 [Bacteroidota bacterium]|nr:hypothetical protein [Odoribacter sp.]MDP3645189.1 hypothetical protein [Bacteroidota bacterium]